MAQYFFKRAAVLMVLAAVVIASSCNPNMRPTQDTTAPAEITELKAAAGNGKVSLSWKNPSDADLYQVEITASPAAGTLTNPVYLAAEKGKAMSFTAEGLSNGTAYTFTVKTIDKSLNKSKGVTTEKPITPSGAGDKTSAPAEVTKLNAVPTGNSKISLSWTNPADVDLHQVEITVQKEDKTVVSTVYISAEKGKDGGYIIEGLAANTTYTVTVKTIDKSLNKSKDGVSKTVTTNATGSVMTITLTQSPAKETKTNGDVTVTVKSSTSIKEAKWMKGAASAKTIFESGTLITGSSFTVSENSIYSVAVLDNDGRREVETIDIKNIDKTPPAPVTGLLASYSKNNKKITVNWKNPPDSDFAELTLRWKKEGGEATNVPLAKDTTGYKISGIEADGSPYTITIIAKDGVGNASSPAAITVTATATAEITNVALNRTHLDTRMSNRDIAVTITGSNFDTLTKLLVQVKEDGGMAQSAVPATIASADTATVTIQAPIPHLKDKEQNYTVIVIVKGERVFEQREAFKVTPPANVQTIKLSKTQLLVGTTDPVTVTVRGTNFDIRGETKIKLLDSKGDEVSGSTVTVPADKEAATEFSAKIPVPSESGRYTVGVYFDDEKEYVYKKGDEPTLHIYGNPEITSVSIPKAGTSYGGKELPVTITGKNFTAPGIKENSFTGTLALSDIKIVSDTLVIAKVDCPYEAGETTVTVTCTPAEGAAVQGSGMLTVKDYTGYTVGKIVLADKTVKSKDEYTAIDSSNPPVGVICGNLYGAPRMIALGISEASLQWANYKTIGSDTKLTGIICIPNGKSASDATFIGDTDGSDNWAYIKQQDPEGTKDDAAVEKNYPAFYWVQKYNTTYAAQLGGRTFDWYMPSLAELCEVSKNFKAIRKSFDQIQDLPNGKDYVKRYFKGYYWSSSQAPYDTHNAWYVECDDGSGYFTHRNKTDAYEVCCIAGF